MMTAVDKRHFVTAEASRGAGSASVIFCKEIE